jgi:hypothetical protein
MSKMTTLKAEIRVIGIDDGFSRRKKRVIVGVVFRGGLWLDGVISSVLDASGSSLGRGLGAMVAESKFHKELRFAILHGAMLGPALAVLKEFSKVTRLPTIALLHGRQSRTTGLALRRAGNAVKFRLRPGLSALCIGLTTEKAMEVLRVTTVKPPLPEPVRVASLIASAANAPKRLN